MSISLRWDSTSDHPTRTLLWIAITLRRSFGDSTRLVWRWASDTLNRVRWFARAITHGSKYRRRAYEHRSEASSRAEAQGKRAGRGRPGKRRAHPHGRWERPRVGERPGKRYSDPERRRATKPRRYDARAAPRAAALDAFAATFRGALRRSICARKNWWILPSLHRTGSNLDRRDVDDTPR